MEFQLKARFVAGGHTTEEPNSITYSSMISREIICIGFLSAYLHGIDITDIDLENAYIIALCAENIWFVGGYEFREGTGRVMIISALYMVSNLKVSRGDQP